MPNVDGKKYPYTKKGKAAASKAKAFTPCRGCPTPAKCKAAKRCLGKRK